MNISALNTKITRQINVFKLQYHRMAKLLTVYEGQLVTPFEQHDVAGDSWKKELNAVCTDHKQIITADNTN